MSHVFLIFIFDEKLCFFCVPFFHSIYLFFPLIVKYFLDTGASIYFHMFFMNGMHLMQPPSISLISPKDACAFIWYWYNSMKKEKNFHLEWNFNPPRLQNTRTTISTAKMKLISLLLWIIFFKLMLPSFTTKQLFGRHAPQLPALHEQDNTSFVYTFYDTIKHGNSW